MKNKGCLIMWIVLFVFVASAYAYNNFFSSDVHTPDYYALTPACCLRAASGRKASIS